MISAQPMSAAECTPAEQRHFIEAHIESGDPFQAEFLEARREAAVVEVTDRQNPGEFVVNPLVIEYAGRIVSYEGRRQDRLYTIPVRDAKVTTQIGHNQFTVKHPSALEVQRTIFAVKDTGRGAVGFSDAAKDAIAVMP